MRPRFTKWTKGPKQLYAAIMDYIAVSDIETLRGEPDTHGEGYWKVKFMSEPYPEQPDPVENPEVNPLCKPTALGDFRGFKNRDMRAEWDKDYQFWLCQTFVVFDSQREYEQWPVEKFHKDRFANKLENMYSEYRDLVDSPYEPGKLAKVERKKMEIKQALYNVTEKYFENKIGPELLENLPQNAEGVELDNCYIRDLKNEIWSINKPAAMPERGRTTQATAENQLLNQVDNRIPQELWTYVRENLKPEDIKNLKLTSKGLRDKMLTRKDLEMIEKMESKE